MQCEICKNQKCVSNGEEWIGVRVPTKKKTALISSCGFEVAPNTSHSFFPFGLSKRTYQFDFTWIGWFAYWIGRYFVSEQTITSGRFTKNRSFSYHFLNIVPRLNPDLFGDFNLVSMFMEINKIFVLFCFSLLE